jgi:hypothetical protein
LADLAKVELAEPYAEMLEHARSGAGGDRPWRERKFAEARALVGLASIAPRMSVEHITIATELRAMVQMRMPVLCRFGEAGLPGGGFSIAHQALIGVRYPREALSQALPGTAFVQVMLPLGVFHPNVSEPPVQCLCLGAKLLPGIPVTELVMMSYRALSMQEHVLDERDPAGILNTAAARWWQLNTDRIPLTRVPFLADENQEEKEQEEGQDA